MFCSEKKVECERLIRLIPEKLPSILESRGYVLDRTHPIDFQTIMKYMGSKGIAEKLSKDFNTTFPVVEAGNPKRRPNRDGHGIPNTKISDCLEIRNIIAHSRPCSESDLDNGLLVLKECCKTFGIRSDVVPLRILACKSCKQIITRTAQPAFETEDTNGTMIQLSRVYDVQVYSVANMPGEEARRDDVWYPGWVLTNTFCSKCHKKIGYRFDWAPEDRVDLDTCKVIYSKDKQAMVVVYKDKTERDLTHVVSDGEIRRHRYGLIESQLEAV